MIRKLIVPVIGFLLVSIASYFGGNLAGLFQGSSHNKSSVTASATSAIPSTSSDTVLIGSFNMQRLGPTKLQDEWVMDKFAQIIMQFDVIALQEITSKDQTTLEQLVQLVNTNGRNYAYLLSPRIGRASTGYYEQYAFVYDADRIISGQEYAYVVEDRADLLHREPFVARFMIRSTHEQPFRFTLVNVHTDPDEIDVELDVLAQVVANVRQFEYPEDDVILLGDLNAGPGQLQSFARIANVQPIVVDQPTNTRKSKTLDNILIDPRFTTEFTSRYGVIDLANWFDISQQQALKISDHLPIWAEFSSQEQPSGTTAALPVTTETRR